MPRFTPYALGIAFAERNANWIAAHATNEPPIMLEDGQKVGKLHTLHFERVASSAAATSRVTPTKLHIAYHATESTQDETVQKRAQKAALRALKKEAEVLLPPRLQKLAQTNGFTYNQVSVKQLKRRWGSCDSHKNLIFNLYLMQLPWQQIDYVLCHELTHTEHMNHGPDFWTRLVSVMPAAKDIARIVRHTEPILVPRKSATAFEDDMPY